MRVTNTEGHHTVSLKLLRFAKAAVVVGLVSAPVAAFGTPAFADTVRNNEWWLRTLHLRQAWQGGRGTGVIVAVLADGADANQPDLTHSVITGPDFVRSSHATGHAADNIIGTGLASLIAGHGHGEGGTSGVLGVAPGARVLSIRVTLSPHDPAWSDAAVTARIPDAIAAGIRYAVRHGATVIDLPIDPGTQGPGSQSGAANAAGGSAAEQHAIDYALSKDVLLVAPAGDDGQAGDAVNFPASYPGVISVGAFDQSFVKAPYSSRRSYVTLTAAGQGVVAAARSGYQTMHSTWAASAITAGIAALIRSQFPNLTATQVRNSLTEGTTYQQPGGQLNGSGSGAVDAERAILQAATMSPPHARPAMAGALPRSRPVAPAVPSPNAVIAHEIMTDGVISGGALAVLLVPIVLSGSAARRREQREAIAAAERSRQRGTRDGQGTMLADPLLEFFGPQHARPAGAVASPRAPAAGRFQPRPMLTGRSMLSPALPSHPQPAAPGIFPAPAVLSVSPDAAAPAQSAVSRGTSGRTGGTSGTSGTSGRTGGSAVPSVRSDRRGPGAPDAAEPITAELPIQRILNGTPTVRQAAVTGSPPWGPAPQPTTELPWAVIPPPGSTAGVARSGVPDVALVPPPPDSVWDSAPARPPSARRSLFDGTRQQPGPRTAAQGRSSRPGGKQQDGSQGTAPRPATWPPGDPRGGQPHSGPPYGGPPHSGAPSSQPLTWQDLARGDPDRPGPDRS